MGQNGRISISHSQALAAQAPLGELQSDLEELIDKSHREEAERDRLRLAATPRAKSKHAELAANGKLGTSATVGYVDQISAYAAKQREKTKRKNAAQPVQYNGPTPERAAKSQDGIVATTVIPGQGPVAPVKNHTMQSPLDKHGAHMGARLENAGRRLMQLYLLAAAGPRVTSSYEGMSGNVPGPRTGGVTDYIRLAASMVTVIEKEWPAEYVQAIEWFLVQTTIKQDGSAMRFEDIGQQIMPFWKSAEAHKGGGYVRFVDMLIHAERWFERQDALGWRGPPPTEEDKDLQAWATAEAAKQVLGEMRARDVVQRELAEAKRSREERRQLQKGR